MNIMAKDDNFRNKYTVPVHANCIYSGDDDPNNGDSYDYETDGKIIIKEI